MGRSGSESEYSGVAGSDSTVFSPETDFIEVDSDLPSSCGVYHQPTFTFAQQWEGHSCSLSTQRGSNSLNGQEDGGAVYCTSCAQSQLEAEESCRIYPLDCCSAPGEGTNDLSIDRRPFTGAEDVQHAAAQSECGGMAELPLAVSNFQNDESNQKEKVFEKAAYERRKHLSSSSDEGEENDLVLNGRREAALNHRRFPRGAAGERRPRRDRNCVQHCASFDKLVVDDLEQVPVDLHNAVLVHLPASLENLE
jgi:hypothetical protein